MLKSTTNFPQGEGVVERAQAHYRGVEVAGNVLRNL